ncbi:MAG: type I pullulanase [Bacteroidota bacterium]
MRINKQFLHLLLAVAMMTTACTNNEDASNQLLSFDDYPVYEGTDLGLTFEGKYTNFKIWAPSADLVRIQFYEEALGGEPTQIHVLKAEDQGIWSYTTRKSLQGLYYTFQVRIKDTWLAEVPDPYAKAVGTNGKRAMVVDLATTNPEGWENDQRPPLAQATDIIIYELHVRDISTHPSSGIQNKGKFLGLTESGTQNPNGEATGLDHFKELGVTHIHLLPSFDYRSIDETKLEENKFNWGYDPENYNVPEGSYATDPADGAVRIREFKQMVQTFHDNGMRVILDVVYNHTGATETSNFNQLVPGYYYRQDAMGGFSNASACGNETASERAMMRKFIMESVVYWATEYHLDGFRFDLMGIHDIETMNAVAAALRKVDSTIFVYGEGWLAGDSPLPEANRAIKAKTQQLDGVAAFSDDIRDAIKGHVFTHDAKGFASGQPGLQESIKFGIVASTQHPQVNYDSINYSNAPWAKHPTQTITYTSCHDNHTLYDRLQISCPEASEAERLAMHRLAGTIVLTSQGVAFLHAGVELARTKNGVENSFESPDSINQIDWNWKTKHQPLFNYFKGLIALRKNHPAFRLPTTELVQQHLQFLPTSNDNLVAYTLSGNANGDSWSDILVLLNGNTTDQAVAIPAGPWTIAVDGQQIDEAGLGTIDADQLTVNASSALVLFKK